MERARRVLPGGTIHTFSHRPPGFPTFMDTPDFAVERGEGAWLYTTDGRRLLDVVLGAGSTLLGHAHPDVVAAAAAQIAQGANVSHVTPASVELAAAIVAAVPGAARARAFNSGSEAMATALRIARAHTGNDFVIKFDGAYHGCVDDVLFGTSYGDGPGPDSPGITPGAAARVVLVPYNDVAAMGEALQAHRGRLAAVLVEPVMRGIAPSAGYLEQLCALVRRERVPLIFDEVITGFRLALGGAQELYGVEADLTVLGKALGAGVPIGAVAGSEELMAWLDPGQPDGRRILAEGSGNGNPLSAAVAVANLARLRRPDTYPRLRDAGSRLAAGLDDVFRRHGLSPHFVGVGPIVEFFFGADAPRDWAAAARSDQRVKRLLAAGLLEHGVFGGGGRYNVSLAHTAADLDLVPAAADAVLSG